MEQADAGPGVHHDEQHSILSMGSALQSLDQSLRQEYDEAVQEALDLVANETKFLDFLRTDDMDPGRAAKRLAMYWKYRKEIFGDRWLLPMTQTGNGALSDQDIQFLRTGYTLVINRPSGGPVCLIDSSRVSEWPEEHINTRITFYLATVMTDVGFQVDGVTIIKLVTSAPRPPINTNPEHWNMCREALPLRLKALLVAQSYEPWKEELIDYLGFQEAMSDGFKTRHLPNIIRGNSVASAATKLESMGIERQYLPPSHGGTFDYSVFTDWTRMRLSLEEIMGSAPTTTNVAFARVSSLARQPSKIESQTLACSPTQNDDQTGSKKRATGKRKTSPVSTPCVATPNYPVMTLVEQRMDLEMRNRILRNDNKRLETLLEQARLVVARNSSDEDNSEQPSR